MKIFTFLKDFYLKLIAIGNGFQDILLLAIRLFWGYQFFTGGLGKIGNISKITSFFTELGIPFPEANAYIVSYIETIGGLCLLLGFASRLAAIPLICVMLVALLTADKDAVFNSISDPQSLLNASPFTFLLASLIIFAFGPGRVSIDYLLERFVFKNRLTGRNNH